MLLVVERGSLTARVVVDNMLRVAVDHMLGR